MLKLTTDALKWAAPFFALGTNGKVELFCSPRGNPNKSGPISFFVQNGYWEGKFDADTQEVLIPKNETSYDRMPAQLLWVGDLPGDKKLDYNEAIVWIQQRIDKVAVGGSVTDYYGRIECSKCRGVGYVLGRAGKHQR